MLNSTLTPTFDSKFNDLNRFALGALEVEGVLGHVFPDGPKPTGLRYCINSTALNLKKDSS